MLPKTACVLMLLSLILWLAGSSSDAHALSPYAQFQSCVPLEEIQCADEKVLLESPRGTPACVKESSVEKLVQRGFVLVMQTADVKPILKNTDNSMSEYVILDALSGNNKLAIDFYKTLSDSNENIFFSPLNLYMLLSALYEGAGNDTAEQIRHALSLEPDTSKRRDAVAQLTSVLDREYQYTISDMANALWIGDHFKPNTTYANHTHGIYQMDIKSIPADIGIIDDWMAEKTHDGITDTMCADGISRDTNSVITSVGYFDGRFYSPFEPDNTYPRTFWLDGKENVTTDFVKSRFYFLGVSLNNVTLIKVPYFESWTNAQKGGISMILIVPHNIDGIKRIEESLTHEMIEQWEEMAYGNEFTLVMPKFTMDEHYDLKKPLARLGITSMFDKGNADLEKITHAESRNLYVEDAYQRSFMTINEMEGDPERIFSHILVPEIIIDRPFIFLLWDNTDDAILFMGRILDPTT